MIAMPVRMQQGSDDEGNGNNRSTSVITRTKPKTKKPSLYRVSTLR